MRTNDLASRPSLGRRRFAERLRLPVLTWRPADNWDKLKRLTRESRIRLNSRSASQRIGVLWTI